MSNFLRFFLLISFVGVMAMGCHSTQSASESKIDSKLSQSGLPDAQPGAGPGEPQKGFDQQTLGAQSN